MRKHTCPLSRCLLFLAVGLGGAGAARADVAPPVHVRILGEPRAAEPGVPFHGRLRIETGAPLVLEDLMFQEDGWDQLALDAGPHVAVDKGRFLEIGFAAVTADPTRPLVLDFTVAGATFTRSFDLSPAGVAAVRGPGALARVADVGDAPVLSETARLSPEPTPSPNGTAPAPPPGEKARTIRVRGRFVYQRSDGWSIGADGLTVRVRDNDSPLGATELAVVATDAQGNYDVTFPWTGDLLDPEPDLYVRFETTNTRVETGSPTWLSGPYAWETATIADYTGADLDLGALQPSDIDQHPAVHIHTNLVRTWRWWTAYGYDTPKVQVNWPDGSDGAFYNGEIHVSAGEQWREDTVCHEYGHHWVDRYAVSPAPSYCNGICDLEGCGHCLWCAETANISFTEGFPDWMGDVIPRSFAASYGRAALAAYDMEKLSMCGAAYADPTRTEGFFAALVRDIGDSANDDHAAYAEADELAVGDGAAIACVDLDHPTTATAFLAAFANRYPAHREGLWATAKNCNYETDAAPPPAVTGLVSTSHVAGGSSADPTIDLAWTRAQDDASGVEGYGITIASGVALPFTVMDLGDVTGYTTTPLPAGTWYFCIRALDRSGKWSGAYAWSGPYTVRSPSAANLAFHQYPGWSHPVVPRPVADATFGSVPEPVALDGDVAATWANVGLRNSGESTTGSAHDLALRVDGKQRWSGWLPEVAAGGSQYWANIAPALDVRGGRHVFEAVLDASELIAEADELDNRWARQWVWSPPALTPGSPAMRSAPPPKTGGWEAVTDGSTLYVNSDGLRMNASSWWDAAVMRPQGSTADYDLYLHSPGVGATDGFTTSVGASARAGGGLLEAVIVNRNQVGWGQQDIGIVNDGGSASYEVVHTISGTLVHGDSLTVAFAQDQMLRLWEISVGAGQFGPTSVTIDVEPAGAQVKATWLDRHRQVIGLGSPVPTAVTDADGHARFDFELAEDGYCALVVWRDPDWTRGNGPLQVTIEIGATPPDFVPLTAAGWHGPIVPRAAADGTVASVPAPTLLPGNTASTYLNVAVRNESPSSSPKGLPGHVHLDGVWSAWVNWGAFPANADGKFNWTRAWTVRGGRHTLAWKLDADQMIEEIHEDNNTHAEQWVWTPLELAHRAPVFRSGPPAPYGDWIELSTNEVFQPNCDGLRLPEAGGYWRAVAVMPNTTNDVDIRLHAASTGAKDGFATSLAGSFWSTGRSDYVLVNFNLAPGGYRPYDAGVVHYQGLGNFTAESTATEGWLNLPNGVFGPYGIAAERILNLVEVRLPAGETGIRLLNLTGNVDWGLSLHRADLAYQGKSDVLGMAADGFGHGQDEMLVVDVPTDGYYCIAVWKKNSADISLAGTYNLLIRPMWASGVDDEAPAPASTALLGVTPNPFNPRTTITWDLARDGRSQLEIYDLQGRLVRTLVDGPRGAGRHTETWNGLDDAGSHAASGMYVARLTTADGIQVMKMTLLK
jgi:hypothetical protein